MVRRTATARAVTAALIAAALPLAVATASAQAVPVMDDFSMGTHDKTVVNATGSVELRPDLSEEFDGTALPAAWTQTPWPSAGAATVAGGSLQVDGARADGPVTAGPGSSLQFVARFGAQDAQHVGFGSGFVNPPWAIFSTGTDGANVYARVHPGGSGADPVFEPVLLPNFDRAQPNTYRIDWTATGFQFYVNGVIVPTADIPIAGPLSVQASDFTSDAGANGVSIDSLVLRSTAGTYTSQVLDAGDARVVGLTFTPTATTPAGTAIAYQTRTGDSATPGAGWSPWQPLTAGGAVQSPPARYLQYQATLTRDSAATTPSLDRVTVDFEVDAVAPKATIGGVTVTAGSATATFSADDPAARFQCSIDGAAFAGCSSPATFAGLAPGSHTIDVRATDEVGNVGAAASRAFTIASTPVAGGGDDVDVAPDVTAPHVSLGRRVVPTTRRGKARFEIGCPDSELRCFITLELKRAGKTVARKVFGLQGGQERKVSLRLSQGIRRRLAERGALKLDAVLIARDEAGNRMRMKRRVKLLAPPA